MRTVDAITNKILKEEKSFTFKSLSDKYEIDLSIAEKICEILSDMECIETEIIYVCRECRSKVLNQDCCKKNNIFEIKKYKNLSL